MSIFFLIVAGLFTVKALLFIVAATLERTKARKRPSNQSLLKISVIVPARNEEDNLAICLHSLLQSTYRNYDIIVVNDRSSDKTGEIENTFAAKYTQVTVINAIEEVINAVDTDLNERRKRTIIIMDYLRKSITESNEFVLSDEVLNVFENIFI